MPEAALKRSLSYHPTELLRALEIRLNRRLVGQRRPSVGDYSASPSEGDLGAFQGGVGSLDLAIVVTTFNRPAACDRLVRQLASQLVQAAISSARLLVLDDASSQSYAALRDGLDELYRGKHLYLRRHQNAGKTGFWRTYQAAMSVLERLEPRHTLFVQDDIELAPDFLRRSLDAWRGIDDRKKCVLNLFTGGDDEPDGRWIEFSRVESPGGAHWLTQWFDLPAFLVGRRFFSVLGYEVFPVHEHRWRRNPLASSGVGAQLTRRLWGRGNVYQVKETLAYHGSEPSLMNRGAREARPLDNRPAR